LLSCQWIAHSSYKQAVVKCCGWRSWILQALYFSLAVLTDEILSSSAKNKALEDSTQDSDQNLFLIYVAHPPDSYRDGIGCSTETTHFALLVARLKVFE